MAKLGTYEVLFELASGGMGTVELAVAHGAAGVERLVAIKRIRPHLTSTEEVVSRFLDEARIASQLHHANVVGLHQASEDRRGYYLVFDYVEGATLSDLVDLATIRDERVPLPVVIRVILDALNGLNAAHEAKSATGELLRILHRDVSKQNLIVGRDGVTRLSDFGISKSTLHSTVTNQSYIAGKLIYMPPEYLQRAPVDRRMDIYAMGVTFWIAVAGQEPWPEEPEAQTLAHILNEGVPSLSAAGVSAPAEIEAIIARACQARASDRFATARQMVDALEDFGRRGGSIASQVEVAEYVEAMAGELLDERRQRIADRLAAQGLPQVSTSPPPAIGGPQHTAPASTTDARTTDSAPSLRRYAVATVAIAAAVIGITLATSGSRAPDAAVLAPSSFSPAAQMPSSAFTAATAVAPEPIPEPVPAIAASAVPSPSSAKSAPHVKRSTAEPKNPAGPAVPTEISTANPYR
jgi:serine/threonine-protein kinase